MNIPQNLALFSLNDKTALVTGGGSGIGQAIALALAKAGAFVWLVSRSNADRTISLIKECGGRGQFLSADVTDFKAINHTLSDIYNHSARIDILVNAAGINMRTPANEMTFDIWQKTIDINLSAPYQLSQLVVPTMKQNKWGRIINIASLQSVRAFDHSIPYGASKGGVVQLTRALAQAYSSDGILVNAIAPGFFHTPMTDKLFQDEHTVKTLAQKTMIKRNGQASDLFGISVFLASDANSYVTGQTIFLDGGFSAQ